MKLFFRFLRNNPLYTLINVVGLALSLMFVILIGDYTYRQFSIDRWHRNHDRICLAGNDRNLYLWPQTAQALKEQFPEIESVCNINFAQAKIVYGDRCSGDSNGEGKGNLMTADSTFFSFFDFKVLEGDPRTALDSPEKCVITKSLADNLFQGEDAIGKPLNIVGSRGITLFDGGGDPYDSTLVYTVSAVIKDIDRTALMNSTEIIVSSERVSQILGFRYNEAFMISGPLGSNYTFLMMRPGQNLDDKTDAVTDFITKRSRFFQYMGKTSAVFVPLDDLMFAPQNDGSGLMKGDKSILGILLAVVLAILLFAISNYINLTVANTGFRAKEMATRRLLGSDSRKISLELILESTMMVFFSFLIGLALAIAFQNNFQTLFQGKIAILKDINFATVTASLLFIIFTGVVSGILPMLTLLKYKPIDIVKGSFRQHSKMVLSKVFIIIQNIITVTMLTATFTILLQMNHLVSAPMGYETEDRFFLQVDYKQRMKDALKAQPYVEKFGCFEDSALDGNSSTMESHTDKDQNRILFYLMGCDRDFLEVSGLHLVEDFHLEGDVKYLNETAARMTGVTRENSLVEWGDSQSIQVAGIFNDTHMVNVLDPYKPMLIDIKDTEKIENPGFLVKTDGSKDAYRRLCALVEEIDGSDFDMEWKVRDIRREIAMSFSNERVTMILVSIFTGIAILISVLGFVGMSVFFIRERRKEVGVRKIMGSTTNQVLALLIGKFCAPLLISLVFAAPLSWYLMNRWLQDFAYRISFSVWIFLAAAAGSLLVAVISVFFQTLSAAHSNPADSIRNE